MNIKKAFTFAELMISLVIIAIVTAILYPTISELTPNNNAHLFKATYKTIEMVISEIVNSPNNATVPQTATDLCTEFEKRLNIMGNTDCTNGFLQTSNGVAWVFQENGIIYVDVNASNNRIENEAWKNNTGTQPTSEETPVIIFDKFKNHGIIGTYSPSNTVARDTFRVTISGTGKITTDTTATQHLQGTTDN